MAIVTHDDLEVCEDCAHAIANGEGTAEHVAEMRNLWGTDLAGMVLACSDCEEECTPFSSRKCDGCGSSLAGSRHLAAVLA